jgi:hypothetical protein
MTPVEFVPKYHHVHDRKYSCAAKVLGLGLPEIGEQALDLRRAFHVGWQIFGRRAGCRFPRGQHVGKSFSRSDIFDAEIMWQG